MMPPVSSTNPNLVSTAALGLALLLAGCSGEPPVSEGTGGFFGASGGFTGLGSGGTSGGPPGLSGMGGAPGSAGMQGSAGAPVNPAPAQCVSEMDGMGNLLLKATEANNYTFSSTLSVSVTPVAPNTELFFDWSQLNKDFLGHPLDPLTSIDMVSLIVWNLPHDEMVAKLNKDELKAAFVHSPAALYTMKQKTSASLFEFIVPGGGELPRDELMARLDPTKVDPATHTYTVMPAEGVNIGEGVRMVAAFRLDPTTTNQTVTITPESTQLTSLTATLSTLTPVLVPAAQAAIAVDWSDMIARKAPNALGREWTDRSVTEVMVAHYTETPAELEQQFLNLELIAEGMWRGEVVAGASLALSQLKDTSGQPFTGIDANGTWVLALICGTCANPAPWYLTILKPCP
ncbi:MAG TPA: hypothetical protein VKY73_00080 [Polyangiaceae bacterium]|nr:hypothetical protein [Polyangiaceae bacterium]